MNAIACPAVAKHCWNWQKRPAWKPATSGVVCVMFTSNDGLGIPTLLTQLLTVTVTV